MSTTAPVTIRMKVERALVLYFRANKAGRFDGLEIVGGHELHVPEGPHLSIYCKKPLANPELGPNSREYIAPVAILINRPTDDRAIGLIEQNTEAAKELLEDDYAAIAAAMNWPGEGRPDAREVRGFHVTDIQASEEDEDRLEEEREDYFALYYDVLCADFDSPPTR